MRFLPYLWYPLIFGGAVAAFALLLGRGMSPLGTAYVVVFASILLIGLLERLFPARREWHPKGEDIRTDLAFFFGIQLLMSRALAMLLGVTLAAWTHAHVPSRWWPHGWPLLAQAAVVALAADFLRYWYHRAAHTFDAMWRLHQVHHAPDVLYALNAVRIHPLEKLLHFLIDSMPFILLGIAPEALAFAYLFYSLNSFFQHCNIDLRYGWLNYLMGGAETHRWHHAKDPRQAYCNFGNTTVVWDVVFRTLYLPRRAEDQVPRQLGIPDEGYPKGFLAQMAAPFQRGKKA